MNYNCYIVSMLCFVLFACSGIKGQTSVDSTVLYEIETTDGNKFIGFITKESVSQITLKTFAYGEIIIQQSMVKGIRIISKSSSKQKQKSVNGNLPDTAVIRWRIEMHNGNEFIGKIENESEDSLTVFTNDMGRLFLDKNQIKHQIPVNEGQMKYGECWIDNPQAARYFWAPNGYGLKKGEGYYQNVWVLFNQVSYGINNYFSLGIGTLPLFLFGGLPTPVWITPKVSIPIIENKFNAGVGILTGSIIGENQASFGLPYGVLTYGHKDANITGGLGWAFGHGGFVDSPTISIGAMARLSRKSYFLTENYLMTLDENIVVITIGGRSVWSKISLDYGIVIPLIDEMDSFVLVPWLGFVLPIGK